MFCECECIANEAEKHQTARTNENRKSITKVNGLLVMLNDARIFRMGCARPFVCMHSSSTDGLTIDRVVM